MAFSGINIRASAGGVTDGAGDTYSLGEAYPVTRGGKTFGFSSNISPSGTDQVRDRGGLDPKLFGIAFKSNSGSPLSFTFDLPSGAGTYNIRLALGDGGAAQTIYCLIKDGASVLDTIGPITTTGAGYYVDADGNEWSDSAYPGNNVTVQRTFSASAMTLEIGGAGGGSGNSAIAHVAVEFVSGGGGGGGSLPPAATHIVSQAAGRASNY